MLFAGTTSILSFKYFILNDIVKKLKQRSVSAGNIFSSCSRFACFLLSLPLYQREREREKTKNGTSETLRNETVVNTENVKPISVHVPKHLKPVGEDQFGHYLAGLIDGDGHFSSKQQLVIVFHSLDASLAYYIKERLGFGSIKKVKDKNAFILVIAAIKGLEKVINLINGKIRTENKFNQIANNILNHDNYAEYRKTISLKLNSNKDLKNHWLAGFSDASSSFKIQLLTKTNQNQPIAPVVIPGASGVGINNRGYNTSRPKALPETRLVVWGQNPTSSVGLGRFTKQISNMIRIPAYLQSVITGLMLSDGWLTFGSKTSKSARLGFKQSLSHSGYFWFVFSLLSPYCSTMPGFISSTRRGTNTHALQILTRSLPCFTELYSVYYYNGIKRIPADIFNLLTPVALAHLVCGDGTKNRHGLTISTESFSVNDTVLLLNVLIVKYGLDCSIRKHSTGYNIYIKEKSMYLLRTLIQPHVHSSMLYKLRIETDAKYTNQVDGMLCKKNTRVIDIKPTTIDSVASPSGPCLERTSRPKASCCSKIKKFDHNNSIEVILNFQIVVSSENYNIALLFKNFFGGLLSYNKLNNEYTYSSSSYGSARNIIKYFDYYHLQSTLYLDYIRWRKSYLLAAKGDYAGMSKYYKVLGSSRLKKNKEPRDKNSSVPTLS